jgi:hypothetical protein
MSEEDRSISEIISDVTEFMEIETHFGDQDVDEALGTIIKLISKPNVPPAVAAPLIVKLQALSSKFALQAKVHMIYGIEESKEDKSKTKNTLMTLSSEMEKLSNALKYLVRT